MALLCFSDVAQDLLQMHGMQYGAEHEDIQGIQQKSILRGVSTKYFV